MTSDHAQQVRVEEINWKAALPIVRLFGAFRAAIRVPNLLIALLLVVTLWLLGQTLDGAFGLKVYQNEIVQYERLSPQSYREWINGASQAKLQQELLGRYRVPGESYQELVSAYRALRKEVRGQVRAVTRYVGGDQVERAQAGQPGINDERPGNAQITIVRAKIHRPG